MAPPRNAADPTAARPTRTRERQGRARLAATALLGALIVVVGAACDSAAPTRSPIETVPADARVVWSIDIRALVADEDVVSLYGQIPREPDDPATFAEFVEEAENMAGVGVGDVSEVVYFVAGDLAAISDDAGKYGFLATGNFDSGEMFAAIEAEAEGETERTQYGGHELLTDVSGETTFTVIDGMYVSGSLDAVHDVIDVAEGEAEALSGTLLDRLDAMEDSWVQLAADVGEDATDLADGVRDALPVDLGLEDTEGFALSVGKQGDDFSAVLTVTYTSPAEAAEAAEVIEALVTLYEAFGAAESDDPLAGLLDELQVESAGSDMSVSLALSVEQVEDLLSLLADSPEATGSES